MLFIYGMDGYFHHHINLNNTPMDYEMIMVWMFDGIVVWEVLELPIGLNEMRIDSNNCQK